MTIVTWKYFMQLDGSIDDYTTSDNYDTDKILATIAAIVLEFTNNKPLALIFAEGSTPARTRLYQMGINKYWNIITTFFEIFGFNEFTGLEPFQSGINYKVFAVKRKNNNFVI